MQDNIILNNKIHGEPLAEQNLDDVLSLIQEIHQKYSKPQKSTSKISRKMGIFENEKSDEIRLSFPTKTIWLYTDYRVKLTCHAYVDADNGYTLKNKYSFFTENPDKNAINNFKRSEILNSVDVVIDGEYVDEQRDVTLKFKGSKNQRVIDVQKSLAQEKVVLYCD